MTVRVADSGWPSLSDSETITINVIGAGGPPLMEGVAINDGAVQRSGVTSLSITFSGPLTFTGSPADAFLVTGPAGPVTMDVVSSLGPTGARKVSRATVRGPGIVNGSLAGGRSTLTIRADRVRDGSGRQLDGDRDGAAGGDFLFGDEAHEAFFRRYGEVDGDGLVDAGVLIDPAGTPRVQCGGDFGVLVGALNKRQGQAGYVDYLDANGDGVIDVLDLDSCRIDVARSILR